MSRQRAQGTRLETAWTKMLQTVGATAQRLAEQGVHDRGDIDSTLPDGTQIIWEAKHVERLPMAPHDLLRRAETKASAPAGIVWKRSTRKPGNNKRSSDGTVVILRAETFMALVARLEGQDR